LEGCNPESKRKLSAAVTFQPNRAADVTCVIASS
jgi:hypothetical protein